MLNNLINVDELAKRLDDPEITVADVRWYLDEPKRGEREYREAHIPGAVYLDLETQLSGSGPGRHPLPEPNDFASALGSLGIDADTDVVVYDSAGGGVAARMWWMLRSIGHRSAAVLDGGIPAWQAAGYPVTDTIPEVQPADYGPVKDWSGMVDLDEVKAGIGRFHIVDARAGERYRGEHEPVDPVAGHIPSAVNLPFTDSLREGRFRTPRELRLDLGPFMRPGTIVYCGSGVNACHHVLAAAVAGLPTPRVYIGSWSDWSSRPDTPKDTGS